MRYMCAERNKLRRVFSTAIDLVKALSARQFARVYKVTLGNLVTFEK